MVSKPCINNGSQWGVYPQIEVLTLNDTCVWLVVQREKTLIFSPVTHMNIFDFKNADIEQLERMSADCMRYVEPTYPNSVFHDNGMMHVIVDHTRYVFDIGEELERAEYEMECERLLVKCGIWCYVPLKLGE